MNYRVTSIRILPKIDPVMWRSAVEMDIWCVSGAGLVGTAVVCDALNALAKERGGKFAVEPPMWCGSVRLNGNLCWWILRAVVDDDKYYDLV